MKTPVLTYCTNVHPLQSRMQWESSLRFFGEKLGAKLGRKPFPMGLWCHEGVLQALQSEGFASVSSRLREWGISCFTMNAFPQGDFHQPEVKKKVYLPDWTDPARRAYTQHCAEFLVELLPEDGFGSISTLPLGWRTDWTLQQSEAAAAALIETVQWLNALRERTGKTVAVALEPEPGCALERTPQVLAFWSDVLRPHASRAGTENILDRHLGICYDTCHQAVQFENPEAALGALQRARIPIHKIQLSSALEFTTDPEGFSRARREQFVEPRFLHQTRVNTPQGVIDFDDLPSALESDAALFAHPWRVHYHVPVHADALLGAADIHTTQGDMLRALRFALQHGLCKHFEVETYTWNVLPESHRPATDEALAECLAQELKFIREAVEGVFDHV